MTEILHQFPASDPKVREAERIFAEHPIPTREQAAEILAKRGINPPDANPLAAAGSTGTADDPALENVRKILARDDLTPEYRAMLEKTLEAAGPLRAKHAAMKKAAEAKAAQP